MYFIRAFSHDPLTGRVKTSARMIPDGVISSKINKAIELKVRQVFKKKKHPVEIGFEYDPKRYYVKQIYIMPLLMTTKAKNAIMG